MAQIICLANSKKHGDRCIAGIETSTGEWIRPVTNLNDGRVPMDTCSIDGEEPRLLDILEIPLGNISPGYERENRLILPGTWKRIGQALPTALVQYCEQEIIYSQWLNAVPFSYLQSLPPEKRRTLQLIKTTKLNVFHYQDTGKWEASFSTSNRQQLKSKITDPAFINRLNQNITPSGECLVTISLGQPWQKSISNEFACWKLVAGVIELSTTDLILFEMNRIGWSIEQGRQYLQQNYNKQSRHQLTANEVNQFLNYLKSLPTSSSNLLG